MNGPRELDLVLVVAATILLAFVVGQIFRGFRDGWGRRPPLAPLTQQSDPITFWGIMAWVLLGTVAIAAVLIAAARNLLNSN